MTNVVGYQKCIGGFQFTGGYHQCVGVCHQCTAGGVLSMYWGHMFSVEDPPVH